MNSKYTGNEVEELLDKVNEGVGFPLYYLAIQSLQYMTRTSTESIDSSEFVSVFLDAEDKIIGGIRVDGTPYYPLGEEFFHKVLNGTYLVESTITDNTEWKSIIVDNDGKLLAGVKQDGLEVLNVTYSDFLHFVQNL